MVSPASPEKARTVEGLRVRVLSSVALRMVAPRVEALDAARSVKSRPVRAMRTSLLEGQYEWERTGWRRLGGTGTVAYILIVVGAS